MMREPKRPYSVEVAEWRTFARLEKKGVNIRVPVVSADDFRALVKSNDSIPRSYSQLKQLSSRLFDRKHRLPLKGRELGWRPSQGFLVKPFEECLESGYSNFFAGLMNPRLRKAELEDLEADMDADTPTFENTLETAHFTLKWTSSSDHAPDNISDSSIIEDTGDYLEAAWDKYVDHFGRDPYVPSGSTKIEVLFQDIGGYGVASPPDGPIKFDAANWVSQPGIRRPTSAHELFHKLQYAFGYRTSYAPVSPYKWFSEGTASWAEVFVWQRVSGSYKIEDLFSSPELSIYDASYSALPFWVFFQARQKSNATDKPMLNYLEHYEDHGIEEQALEESVDDEWASNNVYRSPGALYSLFSRERVRGNSWKVGPTGSVYTEILAPDDSTIEPNLNQAVVPMSSGDTYSVPTQAVGPLAARYFKFEFDGSTEGETLDVTVDGDSAGDFAFYLVWFKDGTFTRATFPFAHTEDHSTSELLTLSDSNEVVLIVSGREVGGSFSLNASIS